MEESKTVKMKLLIILVSLLVAINGLSEEHAWTEFKQTYAKSYKSLREEKLRFAIFKSNLQQIEEHNKKYEEGDVSYTLGINQFSDLSDEEFERNYLGYKPNVDELPIGQFEMPQNFIAPESLDWRSKGAVLSVKDQGDCGSCWAFSAIGALEGQNAIKHHVTEDFSEQELVDCSSDNSGCRGGFMTLVYGYVRQYGVSTLKSYPYVAKKSNCTRSVHPRANITVRGFVNIDETEHALEAAVDTTSDLPKTVNPLIVRLETIIKNYLQESYGVEQATIFQKHITYSCSSAELIIFSFVHLLALPVFSVRHERASIGPISLGIVGNKIKQYNSGVFDDPNCGYVLNHGVLAVGYGVENGKEYWLVKNSWGVQWGENGYIKMSRNKNNQCGISRDATYPVIV